MILPQVICYFMLYLLAPSSPGNHHGYRRQTQIVEYRLDQKIFVFRWPHLFSASILLTKRGRFFSFVYLCQSQWVNSELLSRVTMHFFEMWQIIRKQSLNAVEQRSCQNSWAFHLVCQRAFSKHTFVENIVSFSVMYFLLKCNIMTHMTISTKAI